jgi:hypothetical protein
LTSAHPQRTFQVGRPVYKRTGLTGSGGLIEQYTGSSWQVVSSPDPAGCVYCTLTGVSGSSASDVWAVGEAWFNKVDYDGLIEQYNGSSWSLVSGSQPSNGYLEAVTALSSFDAWAVGVLYNSDNAISGPLIEQYNGSAWTATATSLAPGGSLTAITAVSASDLWAVGNAAGAGIVLNYNGTSWSIGPAPSLSGYDLGYSGLASTGGVLWATGTEFNFPDGILNQTSSAEYP